MSIEENVTARKSANELIELGVTLFREAGLSTDGVRQAWRNVAETAAKMIGDEAPQQVKAADRKDQLSRCRLNDESVLPFQKSKYAGKRLGAIPASYWRWFLSTDWCDKWPELVEYANIAVEDKDD